MRTVVDPDPEKDRLKLEASYANPEVLAERKIFPKSDWEFTKPRPMDWIGFLVAVRNLLRDYRFVSLARRNRGVGCSHNPVRSSCWN